MPIALTAVDRHARGGGDDERGAVIEKLKPRISSPSLTAAKR
jgi:hypothetical protein